MKAQSPKRLLVVTQYYHPENFRINDMTAEWVQRGYDVTVICGIPNYPKGRFLKGYGLFSRRKETVKGVKVRRLPLIPRGRNRLMLALNYLSFAVSGFFWARFTRLEADLVFCFEMSPMSMALPAVWYAGKKKLPCLIYMQDLWPESFEAAAGLPFRTVRRLLAKMAVSIYQRCDRILVTSRSFVEAIVRRGIDRQKISFWPQYAEEFYRPDAPPSGLIDAEDRFTVAFTGNIGTSQGLDILPKTARLLKNQGTRVRFLLVGDGRGMDSLKKSIKEQDVQAYFCFVPQQPPQEIPGLLRHADAAFLSFTDKELFRMTLPAKLQSYMACGKPIVAAAGGETAQVINEARCGLCSAPEDAAALYLNIRTLMAMSENERAEMARRARAYAKAHYDKQTLMDEIDRRFLCLMEKGEKQV